VKLFNIGLEPARDCSKNQEPPSAPRARLSFAEFGSQGTSAVRYARFQNLRIDNRKLGRHAEHNGPFVLCKDGHRANAIVWERDFLFLGAQAVGL